jgi:hypothetical protein
MSVHHGDEPDLTGIPEGDLDAAAEEYQAARRQAYWEAARQIHEAVFDSKIAQGVLVIDGDDGRVGIVTSVCGLQGAFVHFPGSGRSTAEYLPTDRMSLAADQDWEPEGGWRD